MNRKEITLSFILLLMVFFSYAETKTEITSPFNNLSVENHSTDYSFIVSGHFCGASTNTSTFPSSSFLASIDTLNSIQPSFLISLGDLFMYVNENYLSHYHNTVFRKLKMPLFNAVGNHDVSNGNKYEKIFGKTFFSFKKGSELFIILNTEVNDGSIKNEQLNFLKTELNESALTNIKNIFIFSHRAIWAERMEKYKTLFLGNTRTMFGKNNFNEEVKPLLMAVSGKKNVYWLSGSMGGGPSSFFYDKDQETNITFMQTAIRDQEFDAMLNVDVINGDVHFTGFSLTGEKLKRIEEYDITFWQGTKAPEEKFNYRLIPYLTMKMLVHSYFWIGLLTGSILFFILNMLMNKWKRKK